MGLIINGVLQAWGDTEFSVRTASGVVTVERGILAANYGHRTIITNQYGTGRTPIGQVKGQYQLDQTTISFVRQSWSALLRQMGAGWQGLKFDLTLKYRPTQGDPMDVDEIKGRLQGEVMSRAPGDVALQDDIEIVPYLILHNGEVAYESDGN